MATAFLQVFEILSVHPIPLLAFLTFTIILYQWLYIAKTKLPSPRKLPIIGNLHQLGTLPHKSLRSLSQKHGDLMLLHLGSRPTLVVSSANVAEEIMKTHDAVFANRPMNKVASIVLYNGRDIGFAKYGEYYKRIKSICVMHMLSNKKVQSFRKVREEEISLMVERIRELTPSMSLNLTESFTSFTNDVVSRVAFGRKYSGEEGCGNIKELLNDFVEALGGFTVGDFVPWLSWIDHVSGVLRKANKVAKAFDSFIEKIVQEHIDGVKLSQNGVEAVKGDEFQDLADVLLEIQRNDPSLERDTVKALLLDMLSAGIETTSTVLEWTMSELLIHPRVMKKLKDEVRGVSNGKTIINEDDLKNMAYLKAVIKESLRLHPPLPLLLFRESSQDVKVCNNDIAAGTQVIINAWAIQRHPTSWDQPEEFLPERYLNTSVDMKGLDFELIPFGAGRRGCPGMSFATVKAELVLANLVGLFEWEVPCEMQGDSFMAEAFGTSVHKRDPLMAISTSYSRN
ncbi:cytochrome P450 736A117-like [Silene latifolia]|uniref:cytochrome P450 736A117-like n=1 Tax=Silene latifolia TaxID=37657 RepID=UPI003D77CB15